MEFGAYLRDTRLAKGITLEEVEEETKIRKFYIEALENEDFSVLPPQVYACGFVKRYARLLNLDQQQLIDIFTTLAYGEQTVEEPEVVVPPKQDRPVKPRTPRTKAKRKIPTKNIVLAILFFILVVWLGNLSVKYIIAMWQDKEPSSSSQPSVQNLVPQVTEEPPPEPQIHVELEVTDKCWLTVLVDGEQVLAQILPAGAKREYHGLQSIYVRAGNAGGLIMRLNGEEIPPLGGPGEVKEREFTVANL